MFCFGGLLIQIDRRPETVPFWRIQLHNNTCYSHLKAHYACFQVVFLRFSRFLH